MDWTIQDLGSIGELAGSIAVFATLGYLAIQTRQNQKILEESQRHIRAQTYQMRTDSGREVTQLALTVPEVRSYLLAVQQNQEPSDEQKFAYGMVMMLGIRHAENLFHQNALGVLDLEAMTGALELASSIAGSSHARDIWEHRKEFHPDEFVKWMDDEVARAEEAGLRDYSMVPSHQDSEK